MSITDIRKRLVHFWRVYGTLNNIVMAVALVIATGWAWGSVSMIQTNFNAQKSLDDQRRQLALTQLEVDTLQYQQNYYKTDEYKDLAARKDLGLASPGEDVLLLPPNTLAVKDADAADTSKASLQSSGTSRVIESNFDQWMSFLTGGMAGKQGEE
ncbi:MAG: hypothetical protein WBP22_00335 [Candidatus Saccharimonas sp.]